MDRNIKTALNASAQRSNQLRLAEGLKSSWTGPPLNLLYTRLLSCVVLPVSSSLWESGVWKDDDYKLLREKCCQCAGYERVTEQQHRAALEYLESDEGKGSLMAV